MLSKNTIVIGVEGGVVQNVHLVNWEHSVDKLQPQVTVLDYDDINEDEGNSSYESPEALKALEGGTDDIVKNIY